MKVCSGCVGDLVLLILVISTLGYGNITTLERKRRLKDTLEKGKKEQRKKGIKQRAKI